jgi:hypothetical protein
MLFGLFAIGLVVRVLYVTYVAPEVGFGDAEEYISGAQRLLRGEPLAQKNWMLFVRAPGYSLFIALVWKIVGSESFHAVKVAQSLLSSAIVFYGYAFARQLGARTWACLAAAGGAALYPYFIQFCAAPGPEAVFSFFAAAGTSHLALALKTERPRYRQLVIAAVLLSLGNLVRPNLATFLPLLALWIVWNRRRAPLTIAKVGLGLAVPLMVITLPWTLAVQQRGLGWVFVSDGGPMWYFNGHNDETVALYCKELTLAERQELNKFPGADYTMRRPEYAIAKAAPPAEQSKVFMRLALDWDRRNLSALPCLWRNKFFGYWRPWVNPDVYSPKIVALSAVALPVLLLGLYGLWIGWRSGERVFSSIVAIHVITGTVVAVVFSTAVRYRIPIVDALLIPYAAFASSRLVDKLRGPRTAG